MINALISNILLLGFTYSIQTTYLTIDCGITSLSQTENFCIYPKGPNHQPQNVDGLFHISIVSRVIIQWLKALALKTASLLYSSFLPEAIPLLLKAIMQLLVRCSLFP